MQSLISAWLATHAVTHCPARSAANRLQWGMVGHPTRNLPLSLGVVGRW